MFRNYIRFTYFLANPDVWLKSSTEKDYNGNYTYILVYVDDILILDKDPRKFMSMLMENNTVKPSSIGDIKL